MVARVLPVDAAGIIGNLSEPIVELLLLVAAVVNFFKFEKK